MKRFHGNAAMSVALVVEDQSDSSDPIEIVVGTVGVTKNIDRPQGVTY